MSKIGKTELSGTMSGGSMNRERIGNLAITGILGAIAYILMWLEFPIFHGADCRHYGGTD